MSYVEKFVLVCVIVSLAALCWAAFWPIKAKRKDKTWRRWCLFMSLMGLFFLSSARVEAHGDANSRVETTHRYSYWLPDDVRGQFYLLLVTPKVSDFETHQAPIKYIVVWPWLPTVNEQMVRLAEAKLKAFVREEALAKQPKPWQWPWDWDAAKRGLGLLLICIGAGIFLIVNGVVNSPKKKRI